MTKDKKKRRPALFLMMRRKILFWLMRFMVRTSYNDMGCAKLPDFQQRRNEYGGKHEFSGRRLFSSPLSDYNPVFTWRKAVLKD